MLDFVATSNSFSFSSEQDGTSIFFKEEERIRVSVVVTKIADQRLVFLYINGIISSLYQYNALDSFLQQAPQNITIGSSDCNINLYNIRVYNNNLNADQMLSNFIADMDNLVEKSTFTREINCTMRSEICLTINVYNQFHA